MNQEDLHATVISTNHPKTEWEFGIEVLTQIEQGSAHLKVIMAGNPKGERVKFAGPFTSEALKEAARVLNQAARLLDRTAIAT
jgi:hypothetical protein